MREKSGMLIIIISLLFLVGTVEAAIQVSVTGNSSWIVAGSGSSAVYTLTVTDSTSGPLQGANVAFSVDPAFGYMNPASVITNSNGQAVSTFTVNTKSGTAQIFANIAALALSTPILQNIDHGVLSPKFTPATGTVGAIIPFNVSITDQWGNPIDNRRGDDTVSLYVTCPLPNDCAFIGNGHSFSSQPDSNGNLPIPLQLGTKSGLTAIVMSPVQDLGEQVFMIDAIAGDPALKIDISPSSLTAPVNTGVFSFIYTISDNFDNPVANEPVHIVTSLGEILDTKTNAFGQTPLLSYGPKSTVYNAININATSGNLTNNVTVAFSTAETKNMVLYVLPQSLPSLDVDPSSHADVVGKVVDAYGNPISG